MPGTWRPCDPVSSLTIHDLPSMMGHFRYPRWFTTKSIPLILLLINIILVLSCVAIGWHEIRTDSVEQQGIPIELEVSMPGFTAKLSVKGDSALADSERELKALIQQRLRSVLQSVRGLVRSNRNGASYQEITWQAGPPSRLHLLRHSYMAR